MDERKIPPKGDIKHSEYIAIWSKAIDTQMHFNEMCVKSRQLGLTFVAAALGIAVVLLSRGGDFALPLQIGTVKLDLHITVLLILGALLAVIAVRRLDLNVYHKMLRGAVTFGEDFEENYMKKVFNLEKGMTQAVSQFSRYKDASVEIQADGRYKYLGTKKVSAEKKIRRFYESTIWFLCIAAGVIFIITNCANWAPSSQNTELKLENQKHDTRHRNNEEKPSNM